MIFEAKGFIFCTQQEEPTGRGQCSYEFVESASYTNFDMLKDFICDFVDHKVVIQWFDGEELLEDHLRELGLPTNLLIKEYNGECLINRDAVKMDSIRDVLQRLQMGFNENVTEDWDIKFFRYG